jgi:hypothetical protein
MFRRLYRLLSLENVIVGILWLPWLFLVLLLLALVALVWAMVEIDL